MAEKNVITSMLDDLSAEQPIQTAVCLGQDLSQDDAQSIQWKYFNVTEFLILPFQQRYDLGFVILSDETLYRLSDTEKSQILVKLRDLMAKRIVVLSHIEDEQLLRSLGFTQLIDRKNEQENLALWQFNILNYKHVPDWFNSKFWANPDNWNKFRW
jgi:hypothetical protein